MKAREILNIDNFDPLEVDISFIKRVSEEIPQDGFTDAGMAERLATATLKAAELCDDLMAQAVLYLSHCDAQKRAAKSRAIAILLDNKKPSTVVDKLSSSDPNFLEASERYNRAFALHNWLENKHGTLIKTHHWCKDFVRRTEVTLGASGWESSENSSQLLERPQEKQQNKKVGKSAWNV